MLYCWYSRSMTHCMLKEAGQVLIQDLRVVSSWELSCHIACTQSHSKTASCSDVSRMQMHFASRLWLTSQTVVETLMTVRCCRARLSSLTRLRASRWDKITRRDGQARIDHGQLMSWVIVSRHIPRGARLSPCETTIRMHSIAPSIKKWNSKLSSRIACLSKSSRSALSQPSPTTKEKPTLVKAIKWLASLRNLKVILPSSNCLTASKSPSNLTTSMWCCHSCEWSS